LEYNKYLLNLAAMQKNLAFELFQQIKLSYIYYL